LTTGGAIDCWGGDTNGQAADWHGPAASQTFTIGVAQAGATISVSGLDQVYDGSPKPVSVATTPAGLATTVTYDASTTAPTDAGTYAVVVALDDPDHTATPVTGTLTIAAADQSIEFDALGGVSFGSDPVTLVASASSGLAVSFVASGPCSAAGVELSIDGVGTCTVTASQGGSSNWNPAVPVVRSFEIALGASATVLDGPGAATSVGTEATFVATVSTGVGEATGAVTFTTDQGHDVEVALVGGVATWSVDDLDVGSVTVTAAYGGNATLAGSVSEAVEHDVELAALVLEGLPGDVQVGQRVDVVATGFVPGESVVFTLFSDPVVVGEGVADGLGAVVLSFVVPDVAAGSHRLEARGARSGREVGAATTVRAVPVDPDVPADTGPTTSTSTSTPATPTSTPTSSAPTTAVTGELQVTGANTAGSVVVAVLLVLAGVALSVVARRRAQRGG
jgi:hypothetical protein